MTRILVAVLLLLAPHVAQGGQGSILDYELRSLQEPRVVGLAEFAGKPVVMLFFQPECTWCLRQVRTLNALLKECPASFQALAVGVNADRRALQAELRRLRPDFPAFEASPALLDDVGGVPATPYALLGDVRGVLTSWTRGYIPREKLLDSLAMQDCTASGRSPAQG